MTLLSASLDRMRGIGRLWIGSKFENMVKDSSGGSRKAGRLTRLQESQIEEPAKAATKGRSALCFNGSHHRRFAVRGALKGVEAILQSEWSSRARLVGVPRQVPALKPHFSSLQDRLSSLQHRRRLISSRSPDRYTLIFGRLRHEVILALVLT